MVLLFLLIAKKKRLYFTFWSPVHGVPIIYGLIGSLGYFYYQYNDEYLGGFYDVGVYDSELIEGLSVFFSLLVFF
ncbi:hypothetical protein NURINAE_00875 [Candidatus Nitrosacidococcus sp. I8]|nr:hypothetical protein NURINAE_00875 [Candidatus Nitrosacidococcus sp. I8]